MDLPYSQNRLRGCFGAALANFFFTSIGEADLAQKVNDAYPRTQLVRESDGRMHVGLASAVVRDLTDELYEGILYINFNAQDLLRETQTSCGDDSAAILRVINDETKRGNIISHNETVILDSDQFLLYIQREDGGHWVVGFDDGKYCDNGIMKESWKGLSISGVLEIRKNKKLEPDLEQKVIKF